MSSWFKVNITKLMLDRACNALPFDSIFMWRYVIPPPLVFLAWGDHLQLLSLSPCAVGPGIGSLPFAASIINSEGLCAYVMLIAAPPA